MLLQPLFDALNSFEGNAAVADEFHIAAAAVFAAAFPADYFKHAAAVSAPCQDFTFVYNQFGIRQKIFTLQPVKGFC